jgi:signal transduction histidine kinase
MALAAAAPATDTPAARRSSATAAVAGGRGDLGGRTSPRRAGAPGRHASPLSPWLADLDRGLAQAIAICAVVGVAGFALDPAFTARYSTGLALLLAAFALAALGCVADAVSGARRRYGVRAFVGLGVVLCAAMPFLFPPDPSSTAYPPFIHVITVAVLATPYAVSAGAGALASVVLAAALLQERTVTVGSAQARWEAISFLGAGLVGVTVFLLLRDRAGQVAEQARHTRLAEEVDAREAAATRERDRWDCLVHDKVLGALLTASRSRRWSTERAGQALAADALRALELPADEGSVAFLPAIRRRAAALHLDLRIRDDARGPAPPDEVIEALTDATIEALVNVARHAGVTQASVTVQDCPGRRRVVVADEGFGFDPESVSDERAGMRLNIRARIESVGGTASIESVPGAGTRVILDVPCGRSHAGAAPRAWTPRMFRPALACAALCVLGHAAIGVLWLGETAVPRVTFAGLVVTPLAMVVAWSGSAPERWTAAWVVVGLGVPTILALNLVGTDPDWRWWFVGYQNLLVCTLAFRGNVRAAYTIALGMPVLLGLAMFQKHGTVPLAALLGSCLQVFVWAVVGAALRRAMDSAMATIGASERERGELRLARSLRDVREAARAERLRELGANVVPMLRRLCRPADLTDEQRRGCFFLEAAARDQLVARCLVTPEVAAAVSRSRRLGATVEIVAAVDDSGPAVAAFRDLIASLLPVLGCDTRLRATWRYRDGAPAGIVVIVSDGGAASRVEPVAQQVRARWPQFAVDTSYDDAAALVVLRPQDRDTHGGPACDLAHGSSHSR